MLNIINTDTVVGTLKELIGAAQENIGRFLGSREQETLGYNLEFEGLAQRKKGEAKTAYDDLIQNGFFIEP